MNEISDSFINLYHITKKDNVESILRDGLIAQYGPQRQRCKIKRERESKDLWVSFCNEKEICKWRRNLFSKLSDDELAVLNIKFPRGLYKVMQRTWTNGTEYGIFENVDSKFITQCDSELFQENINAKLNG